MPMATGSRDEPDEHDEKGDVSDSHRRLGRRAGREEADRIGQPDRRGRGRKPLELSAFGADGPTEPDHERRGDEGQADDPRERSKRGPGIRTGPRTRRPTSSGLTRLGRSVVESNGWTRCRTSISTTARTTTTTSIRQRGDGSRPVGKTNGTNSVTITVPGTQARAVSHTTQTAPGMPALTIAVATATPPNASARRTPPSHSSQPIG